MGPRAPANGVSHPGSLERGARWSPGTGCSSTQRAAASTIRQAMAVGPSASRRSHRRLWRSSRGAARRPPVQPWLRHFRQESGTAARRRRVGTTRPAVTGVSRSGDLECADAQAGTAVARVRIRPYPSSSQTTAPAAGRGHSGLPQGWNAGCGLTMNRVASVSKVACIEWPHPSATPGESAAAGTHSSSRNFSRCGGSARHARRSRRDRLW